VKPADQRIAIVNEAASTVPTNAVDLACKHIIEQVRLGFWPGGYTLTEVELTEWLQVSRSTVREALRRLEAEGMLVKNRSRNLAVRRLSRRDVVELYELRELLEGLAASRAAKHFGSAPTLTQRNCVAILKDWQLQAKGNRKSTSNTSKSKNQVSLQQDNRAFHSLVWRLSDNQHLPRLLGGTLMTLFQSQFRLRLKDTDMQMAASDHVEVLEAIMAGNAPDAERKMRQHIRASAQLVLNLADEAFS
jgi:DNA-binding GntR family transcriptional regulator